MHPGPNTTSHRAFSPSSTPSTPSTPSSPAPGRDGSGFDISDVRTSLLTPKELSNAVQAATQRTSTNVSNITVYEVEAKRRLATAERYAAQLKHDAGRMVQLIERWQFLLARASRTPTEVAEIQALEQQIPQRAARIAQSQRIWSDVLAAAHDHADAAAALRKRLNR